MAKKLKIIAKKDGFRRAGYVFSTEQEKVLAEKDLTEDQIKQLKAEKMLVVTEVEETERSKPAANKKPSPKKPDGIGKSVKPSEQEKTAEELIQEIEASEDKTFLTEALKDSHKTVKEAAEKRLKSLEE